MVTGRHVLGNLTVGITAPLGTLRGDLRKAEGAATSAGGKMGAAFQKFQGRVQGAARQVPIFGDQLAALATPTGVATVAFGALTAAVVGSIQKVANLERELRPMQERSGLTAESLQVLTKAAERLGSEDGLEGVTDSAQELQLRLAEAVQDGTGPAVAAFEKLGLASEDLIQKSPEEMLLAVITALQNVTNEADRKFLADELLGGSSEKLAGILNAESVAFQQLTADIRENADIVSNEAIESARDMDAHMNELKGTIGQVQTAIASALIPAVNDMVSSFKSDLNETRTEWTQTKDVTLGALESVTNFITGHVDPVIVELGEGFEDMSATVLESGKSTFDPQTEGSYPAIMADGLNTAVQSNKDALDAMATEQRTSLAAQQQAERDRQRELAERRAEHYNAMLIKRQEHSEDIEEEVEENLEAVEVKYDTHYTDLETDTDQHFSDMTDKNDQYWIDLLQANQDSYDRRLEAQLAAYDEEEQAADNHFQEVADATGIHLSNIETMYAMSGLQVSATWNQVMDNLTQQVHAYTATLRAAAGPRGGGFSMFEDVRHRALRTADESELRFYFGLHGQKKAVHKQTGENYIYHNGQWVSESDYHHNLYADDRAAADPIGRGDPRALTRSDLGLGEVGSTPPTLPGLPGFATGGIAMRPMAANIAEHGPEAIIPLNRMQPSIIINVNEGAYVVDDFVEAVQDALHEARRDGVF